MITVTPQVLTEIEDGKPPISLVKFSFSGVAPIYLTTAGFDIEWDGVTWLANGFLLDTELQERISEIRTSSGAVGLTGVDLSIAAILLNNNQVGRRVDVYSAWLDVDGGVIPDPYLRDSYYIDDWTIEQGTSTATVVLNLSGEWADFEVKKGIKTTDANIKRHYPSDDIFKYSKDIKQDLRWGGE